MRTSVTATLILATCAACSQPRNAPRAPAATKKPVPPVATRSEQATPGPAATIARPEPATAASHPAPSPEPTRPIAAARHGVSASRLARLGRGVNINNWFSQPYHARVRGKKGTFDHAHFRGYVTGRDASMLRAAGFTYVRLPVDPQVLMDVQTGQIKPRHLPELDRAVEMLVDAGLAVTVDAHPKMSAFKKMRHTAGLSERYVAWWGRFAAHLDRTTSPEWVFIEPLNEPGGQSYYGKTWATYQDNLIDAIRAAAPRHTIVANAGGYQLVKEQVALVPHADENVVYAVHYYAPSQFTHQGALWMKDWYRPLRNVPWPLTKENLRAAQDGILETGKHSEHRKKAMGALSGMVKQGLGTRVHIERDFDRLAAWSKTHDRRIIVNEFGVYKPFAPRDDRMKWLAFVRAQCEKKSIGWCMWEYAHEFGFAEGEPDERTLDTDVVTALGLTSSD